MAAALITLDTSGLYELLDGRSSDHHAVAEILRADRGPFIIPVPILAEIAYMVEARLGIRVMDAFLTDLETGAFSLDCGLGDLSEIRQLVLRYADLSLGFADASVIACAERNGGRVLTLDRSDFGVVARERRLELFPR